MTPLSTICAFYLSKLHSDSVVGKSASGLSIPMGFSRNTLLRAHQLSAGTPSGKAEPKRKLSLNKDIKQLLQLLNIQLRNGTEVTLVLSNGPGYSNCEKHSLYKNCTSVVWAV